MAFKKQTDKGQGVQFVFDGEGSSLTGYYLGSFDFEGDYGPTKIHMFKNEDGVHSIFGQKQLMSLLADLTDKVGCNMRITYVGEKPNKKKGFHAMKLYELEYDEEDRMDDADLSEAAEAAQSQSDGDDEPQDEASAEEQGEPEKEQAPPKAAAKPAARPAAPKAATPAAKPPARPQPSAEAKARTQALLGARK